MSDLNNVTINVGGDDFTFSLINIELEPIEHRDPTIRSYLAAKANFTVDSKLYGKEDASISLAEEGVKHVEDEVNPLLYKLSTVTDLKLTNNLSPEVERYIEAVDQAEALFRDQMREALMGWSEASSLDSFNATSQLQFNEEYNRMKIVLNHIKYHPDLKIQDNPALFAGAGSNIKSSLESVGVELSQTVFNSIDGTLLALDALRRELEQPEFSNGVVLSSHARVLSEGVEVAIDWLEVYGDNDVEMVIAADLANPQRKAVADNGEEGDKEGGEGVNHSHTPDRESGQRKEKAKARAGMER